MNRRAEAEGGKTYVNPRNTAAGSLRQLDTSLTAARPIRLFCYSIIESTGKPLKRQWLVLEKLRDLGFPVEGNARICEGIEEVITVIQQLAGKRDSFASEIDGIVIKLDDLELANSLGIDQVVRPGLQLAQEIVRIVSVPGALDLELFAGGKVKLLRLPQIQEKLQRSLGLYEARAEEFRELVIQNCELALFGYE